MRQLQSGRRVLEVSTVEVSSRVVRRLMVQRSAKPWIERFLYRLANSRFSEGRPQGGLLTAWKRQ
jgi:hypothetical protein